MVKHTEHCDLRSDCFEDVIDVMGKELSIKTYLETGVRPPAASSAVVAGLNFCEQGVGLADNALDGMKYILTEFEPKNVHDVQHVHGCIQYAQSAFRFDNDNRTQVGDLMGIISDAQKNKANHMAGATTCGRPVAVLAAMQHATSNGPPSLAAEGPQMPDLAVRRLSLRHSAKCPPGRQAVHTDV